MPAGPGSVRFSSTGKISFIHSAQDEIDSGRRSPRLQTTPPEPPMTFVMTAAVAHAAPSPPVALFSGLNNVYGRAQYKKDAGVVKYLGQFNETSECSAACLAFKKDGNKCLSFTHHLMTMPTNWKGLCFAIADHSWKPMPDSSEPPVIASGQVAWDEAACGSSALKGCTWQVDPWCLHAQYKYAELTVSTQAAEAACSADAQCLGFTLTGPNASSTTPVAHSLYNNTAGGPGGCWAHRKHFALSTDPYRAAFHFQPAGGHWMNDPNGPMYYRGLYHLFYRACQSPSISLNPSTCGRMHTPLRRPRPVWPPLPTCASSLPTRRLPARLV